MLEKEGQINQSSFKRKAKKILTVVGAELLLAIIILIVSQII